jgi:hypothetical protein
VWMVDEVGGKLHPNSHARGKAMVPFTLAALDPVEKLRPEEDDVQELKTTPKGSVDEQSDKHDGVLQVWCTVVTHCVFYRYGRTVLIHGVSYCRYGVLYSYTVYPTAGMVYCTHALWILQVSCTVLIHCVSCCRYDVLYSYTVYMLQLRRTVLIHGVSYCRYGVLYSYTVYLTAGIVYCMHTRCSLLQVWRTVLIHDVSYCRYDVLYSYTVYPTAGIVYCTHTRCIVLRVWRAVCIHGVSYCWYDVLYSYTVYPTAGMTCFSHTRCSLLLV